MLNNNLSKEINNEGAPNRGALKTPMTVAQQSLTSTSAKATHASLGACCLAREHASCGQFL